MDDVWSQGDAYERFMGRWSRRVAPQFVAWLDLPAGLRWADVGCGSGALTSAILDLGAPSSVLGVDPSPAQVTEATRRVRDQRASFARGTSEDLSPGGFDAVASGLVLNFVPESGPAVASMARAAPGGVIAAYVWDYAEGMQLLRTFWDVACALDPSAADLNEGHRFTFDTDALVELWLHAGMTGVTTSALTVQTVFADFDDLWSPFLGGQGPAPAYVSALDEPAREQLRSTLQEALDPEPDGSIHLSARAWAVRGTSGGNGVS
jgi:SAM-dependent methyltransferase